jgi:hypothetical protein
MCLVRHWVFTGLRRRVVERGAGLDVEFAFTQFADRVNHAAGVHRLDAVRDVARKSGDNTRRVV